MGSVGAQTRFRTAHASRSVHRSDRVHFNEELGVFLIADALEAPTRGHAKPIAIDAALAAFSDELEASASLDPSSRLVEAIRAADRCLQLHAELYRRRLSIELSDCGDPRVARRRAVHMLATKLGVDVGDDPVTFSASLTALYFATDYLCIAQIGACRAYHVGSSSLARLIVADHTLGTVRPGTPKHHALTPTRALGSGPPASIDLRTESIDFEADYVLCTDGVWTVLSRSRTVLNQSRSGPPEQTAQKLVELAASTEDDATVLVVRPTA